MKAPRHTRLVSAAALLLFAARSATPADQPDRAKFVKKTVGPVAILRSVAGAGIDQATGTPREWGHGITGFVKRFSSAFGQHIVKKSIEFPVAKLRHEEFGYRVSDKSGFKSRLTYALTALVITHKTTDGSKMLHASEISGAIGSGLISRLWQPASTRTLAAGFGSAGTILAADAGWNVVREFWPEIRHPHSHAAVRAALLEKRRGQRAAIVSANSADSSAEPVTPNDERDREEDGAEPAAIRQ